MAARTKAAAKRRAAKRPAKQPAPPPPAVAAPATPSGKPDDTKPPRTRGEKRALTDNQKRIIIIGDDGKYYMLEEADWKASLMPTNSAHDADAVANVNLLRQAGSYLAFLDPEIAAGAGMACTVVNLEAILREASYRP